MKNKSERLLEIRKLINSEKIASQDELLNRLKDKGFSMTQATLSRDLKYLRVSKVHDADKGSVYHLQDAEHSPQTPFSGFLVEGLLTIEFAQGLGIIRTMPGYASSIAFAIDNMNIMELAGTIAGDDTIMLIPRDGARREDIYDQLSRMIPNILTKRI